MFNYTTPHPMRCQLLCMAWKFSYIKHLISLECCRVNVCTVSAVFQQQKLFQSLFFTCFPAQTTHPRRNLISRVNCGQGFSARKYPLYEEDFIPQSFRALFHYFPKQALELFFSRGLFPHMFKLKMYYLETDLQLFIFCVGINFIYMCVRVGFISFLTWFQTFRSSILNVWIQCTSNKVYEN